MAIKLYTHQQKLVDKNPKRACAVHDVGTGKTLTLLTLAEKNARNALIICPKGMKQQWLGKVKEYGIKIPIKVITKEEHRRDWDKLPCADAVIVDEVHHHSNPQSQMHKNLIRYLKKAQPRFVWSGTATPYRSEPFNIWALGVIHGHMPLNWVKFREKFYHIRYLGHRMIWEANEGEHVREELRRYMEPWADFVKLEECFDMPDQIDEEPEVVGMTPEQTKLVEKMKLEEANPLVLVGMRHQIENGGLKGNEFRETIGVGDLKMPRIIELAEQHDKLLIFCRYTLQIRAYEAKLRELGYVVDTITGENSAEHFNISVRCENAVKSVLIAQITVAAGWEVPSFPVVVYASMSYGYLDFIQSRGRAIRGNKLQKHVFLYLQAGEIDKAVFNSVMDKRDFDPATF